MSQEWITVVDGVIFLFTFSFLYEKFLSKKRVKELLFRKYFKRAFFISVMAIVVAGVGGETFNLIFIVLKMIFSRFQS